MRGSPQTCHACGSALAPANGPRASTWRTRRAVLRSFRQMFHAFWVVLASLGYLRRGRSCETEIDDVYAGPGFPLNVGWL